MKRSKILVGSRRGGGGAAIGGDEDDLHDLLQPREVVIVEDTDAYELFGDRIFCAPQVGSIRGTQLNAFGLSRVTYCS